MAPSRRLQLTVDGFDRVEPMLLVYIVASALSAGMCYATCVSVFKWSNVFREAGHGTLFLFFCCECLWSCAMLARTCAVFANTRGIDTLEDPLTLDVTIATEVLFNATSLWLGLAAYEIHRRALRPRPSIESSRRAMLWYCASVGLFAATMLAVLIAYDASDLLYFDASDGAWDALAAWILEYMSWGTRAIRLIALVYAATVAGRLYCRRAQLQHNNSLPTALVAIVGLFFVLNMPILVLEPLHKLHVISISAVTESLLKALTFSSGAVISLVMGLSVAGYDAFYTSTVEAKQGTTCRRPTHHLPPPYHRASSFFVLSDS
ncbi:Aste57867_10475 [Aphanomyces stellatus]|uniref:Aste57867_10475 protein n=1 Tax=Aphanomyces stellatus TaxID=120398 RepID=A0A485KQX9_9STRA|nr:hypothetical protein As57867_010435 [Aphanomyces stellatus]VFT87349.1 Aste57867_10475 [Aphanomyces stellatus]